MIIYNRIFYRTTININNENMKKNLLSIMLMTITIGYTTAQEAITTVPTQVSDTSSYTQDKAIIALSQCDFTPVTHWSIGIKAGGNYFRVAPEPVSRLNQVHLIFAATVEYTINPLVGIGLEYMDNPYSRSYYLDETLTTTGRIDGASHDLILYGSINLSNLLTPYRKGSNSKWNVYAKTGDGYAFYNNALHVRPNNINMGPMGNVGVNAEYLLSKDLSLGFEGQYRFYHRKLVEGPKPDKSNALALTIGLRYKFNAKGKTQHARNISMCEYYPKPAPVIIEKIVKDNTAETLDRLKAIEAENAALNDKIKKLNDAIVAFTIKDKGTVNTSFPNIQFEFGSAKISRNSYSSLDQIATMLKDSNATVKLSVAGYTDYIGTEKYNRKLSVKRAKAVKDYLLSKNVPASNISIIGYGEEYPIAPNETTDGRQKNRRVEFKITK
jgi:outer membrane protein OmpA-like peptidoglycan-associated protein